MADRYELAWAAGFFEGEGSVGAYSYPRRGRNGRSRVIRAALHNTDLEPLERFAEAIGFGPVRGPYFRGHKPIYVWSVSSLADVQRLWHLLEPDLSTRRREQFHNALESRAGWVQSA